MSETLAIPRRFNGPLDSGNGGYAAGALAVLADRPVEVSLRRPVPLGRPLAVRRDGDGGLAAFDGDELVAEGSPAAPLALDLPAPASLAEAAAARERYRGLASGPFARCFVCGRARDDALEVEAGPVDGRDLVASPWTPPAWTADGEGRVRPEIVWAVLDCPTYFAVHLHAPDPLPAAVLARFAVRIDAPVAAGAEHVVIAWPIEIDGRKLHAGSAILSADGEALAVARALLIAPRDA